MKVEEKITLGMKRVEEVLRIYKKEKMYKKMRLFSLYIGKFLAAKGQAHKLTYLWIVNY